jgi:DNA invertase Pin-like site-specific DNA recombinase
MLKGTKTQFAAVRDNIDMTTPQGELLINVMASFSQFEKSLISERTRSGMHAARINNPSIVYGRKPKISIELQNQIKAMYEQGHTLKAIQSLLGLKYNMIQRTIAKGKI